MPAEALQTERFRTFIAEVAAEYEFVVFDCPPLLPVVDATALIPYVDSVLLCVRAGQTTRDQVKALTAALGQLPDASFGVVVTGVRAGQDEAYSYTYAY